MIPEVTQGKYGRIYTGALPNPKSFSERNRFFPVYAHIDRSRREESRLVLLISYAREPHGLYLPAQMQFRSTDVIDILKHDFDIGDERLLAPREVTGYIINPGREEFAGFSKKLSTDQFLTMRQQYWKSLG